MPSVDTNPAFIGFLNNLGGRPRWLTWTIAFAVVGFDIGNANWFGPKEATRQDAVVMMMLGALFIIFGGWFGRETAVDWVAPSEREREERRRAMWFRIVGTGAVLYGAWRLVSG